MKYIYIFITGVLLITIIFVIIWFFIFSRTTPQTPSTSINNFPSNVSNPTQAPGISQENSNNATTSIQQSFITQLPNLNDPLLTFRNLTIVYPYAVQHWTDEEVGGVALLKYDPVKGWVVVLNVGGALDISSLVNIGVPTSTAQQLIGAN